MLLSPAPRLISASISSASSRILASTASGIVPVEPDLARLGLQLERAGECGQGDGDALERTGPAIGLRLGRLFLGLDALPQHLHFIGRGATRVAEHMRVPANELFRDGRDHVAEIERALLLRHAGMERDLKQQVAQLFAQVGKIAASDRVGHFIGFLDRVGGNGREILLEVPGAAGARRAQRRHDLDQPCDVAGWFHAEPRGRSADASRAAGNAEANEKAAHGDQSTGRLDTAWDRRPSDPAGRQTGSPRTGTTAAFRLRRSRPRSGSRWRRPRDRRRSRAPRA